MYCTLYEISYKNLKQVRETEEQNKMMQETPISTVGYAMNGGDGPYIYANNSTYQRTTIEGAKGMINEAIADMFDVKHICSSSQRTLCIADLGCSVGPNTFIAMQNVIDAIKLKYEFQGLNPESLAFQVFFSDQVSNDFNKLFASLPPNRQYFASAVPGSFHKRLFPKASLHFVHSSTSLHWLSKVPKQVEDVNSPAYNKGRIHFGGASKEVKEAYLAQFVKDMESFLSARAEELVSGGLMALVIPTRPKENLTTKSYPFPLDILGSCLMDMAKNGVVNEAKVDSFNMPLYSPTVEEFEETMKCNGHFSIERLDLLNLSTTSSRIFNVAETMSMHLRAGLEILLSEHFGTEIIDELFVLFTEKAAELPYISNSENNRVCADLFILLKRK